MAKARFDMDSYILLSGSNYEFSLIFLKKGFLTFGPRGETDNDENNPEKEAHHISDRVFLCYKGEKDEFSLSHRF